MWKEVTTPSPSIWIAFVSCPPMSRIVRVPGKRAWAPRPIVPRLRVEGVVGVPAQDREDLLEPLRGRPVLAGERGDRLPRPLSMMRDPQTPEPFQVTDDGER